MNIVFCSYFYQMFLDHKKRKTHKSIQEKRGGILSLFRRRHHTESESRPASEACTAPDTHLYIPVTDHDDDVFRRVVSFVHYGHVTVTAESVVGK